jgi:hypothetical protein
MGSPAARRSVCGWTSVMTNCSPDNSTSRRRNTASNSDTRGGGIGCSIMCSL